MKSSGTRGTVKYRCSGRTPIDKMKVLCEGISFDGPHRVAILGDKTIIYFAQSPLQKLGFSPDKGKDGFLFSAHYDKGLLIDLVVYRKSSLSKPRTLAKVALYGTHILRDYLVTEMTVDSKKARELSPKMSGVYRFLSGDLICITYQKKSHAKYKKVNLTDVFIPEDMGTTQTKGNSSLKVEND